MPKYAVAVGREVGIYDTYEECFKQINGFPKARFKKFNTVEEAEEFIKTNSNSSLSFLPQHFLAVENKKPSTSFQGTKVSNSEQNSLKSKITLLEKKLDKFISNTNDSIDQLSTALTTYITSTNVAIGQLSTELTTRIESLEKKRGLDLDSSEVDFNETDKRLKLEPHIELTVIPNPDLDFIRNESGVVVVYTDGSCVNNGRKGAKAGVGVWFNHNHPLNVSAPVSGPATNNNAEIQAARIAITQSLSADLSEIVLQTDSKFVINCITKWIHKWQKNNWTLSSGGPVKNKEELVKLYNVLQSMRKVHWTYVPGHKGDVGNESADQLARRGAEQYSPTSQGF